MARDAALISTWQNTARGREAKAVEVFMEFLQFWGKHAAEGRCSQPETYFNYDGSEGMNIVRGKSDALMEIWESDESQKLIAKGQLIVEGLKAHLWLAGEAEITHGMSLYTQAGNEMGYM